MITAAGQTYRPKFVLTGDEEELATVLREDVNKNPSHPVMSNWCVIKTHHRLECEGFLFILNERDWHDTAESFERFTGKHFSIPEAQEIDRCYRRQDAFCVPFAWIGTEQGVAALDHALGLNTSLLDQKRILKQWSKENVQAIADGLAYREGYYFQVSNEDGEPIRRVDPETGINEGHITSRD